MRIDDGESKVVICVAEDKNSDDDGIVSSTFIYFHLICPVKQVSPLVIH